MICLICQLFIFITFYFIPPKKIPVFLYKYFPQYLISFLFYSNCFSLLTYFNEKKKLQVSILFALKQKVPHEMLPTNSCRRFADDINERVSQVQTDHWGTGLWRLLGQRHVPHQKWIAATQVLLIFNGSFFFSPQTGYVCIQIFLCYLHLKKYCPAIERQ